MSRQHPVVLFRNTTLGYSCPCQGVTQPSHKWPRSAKNNLWLVAMFLGTMNSLFPGKNFSQFKLIPIYDGCFGWLVVIESIFSATNYSLPMFLVKVHKDLKWTMIAFTTRIIFQWELTVTNAPIPIQVFLSLSLRCLIKSLN